MSRKLLEAYRSMCNFSELSSTLNVQTIYEVDSETFRMLHNLFESFRNFWIVPKEFRMFQRNFLNVAKTIRMFQNFTDHFKIVKKVLLENLPDCFRPFSRFKKCYRKIYQHQTNIKF